MKILIVEDDLMVAFLNQEFCRKYNPQVEIVSVTDVFQAREKLNKDSFDLVLLDMFMPKGNGLDILVEFYDKSAFILITADSSQTTLLKALEHGAVDYLLKPYAYERFKIAMERFEEIQALKKEKNAVAQARIDSLFGVSSSNKQLVEQKELPKGLNKQTLLKIIQPLEQAVEFQATVEIAEQIGLSRISTKKYLDFLVSEELLSEKIIYLKQGRPVAKYKINPEQQRKLQQFLTTL